jgi:hypothetical protein
MQRQMLKQLKKDFSPSILSKYGAILLLLSLSVVVVACGASGTTSAAAPQPTSAPIKLASTNLSPTPTLPPQWCGIWVTNPSIASGSSFNIYAEFNSQVSGNPQGIPGTVQFSIQWGDGSAPQTMSTTTSSTGVGQLTVQTTGHTGAVNKLSLITANFTSNTGNITCTVDNSRAASFTLTPAPAPVSTPAPANTTNPPTTKNNPKPPIIPTLPSIPTNPFNPLKPGKPLF